MISICCLDQSEGAEIIRDIFSLISVKYNGGTMVNLNPLDKVRTALTFKEY